MACWVGTQSQVKSAKKAKTCPDYDVTHRKPQTQNKKNSNGNKRLLKSIEDLNPLA